MPKPKGGLGRGLNSLIPQQPYAPQTDTASESRSGEPLSTEVAPPPEPVADLPVGSTRQDTVMLTEYAPGFLDAPIASITPNPHQPRQAMRETDLDDLAASIREHGVLQPLVVTRAEGREGYTLVAGERRWRAALLAGLNTVPVVVKEATPREMLELALVENLQRADLNPLEEAAAYKSLLDDFGMTQEDVSTRVGKSRVAVTNSLRLLTLPRPVQESLAAGLITAGHARAILQVQGEADQLRLLELAVADGLSVRQVEALARQLAERPAPPKQEEKVHEEEEPIFNEVRELEDRFRNALGTRVQLSRSSRGGRLVIYFYSNEELDRIYGTIVGDDE